MGAVLRAVLGGRARRGRRRLGYIVRHGHGPRGSQREETGGKRAAAAAEEEEEERKEKRERKGSEREKRVREREE